MILVNKKLRIIFFSGLFLFLLPFLNFLNINTYEVIGQFKLIYFLLFLTTLIVFLLFSLFISKLTKQNIFIIFFFTSLFFFIQFYFNLISITLEDFGIKGGTSKESFFFIFFLFLLLIFLQYKNSNLFFKFFFIFTLLNFIYNSFFILKNIFQGDYFYTSTNSKNITKIKQKTIINNNIYLIFLDGMVSLEKFDNYFDVNIDKLKINFNNNNLKYKNNAKSIATTTRLTFASFFNLNPVTLDNKKFKNRPKLLFPGGINKSNLMNILESNNYKFNWIGNAWMDCYIYNHEFCLSNKAVVHYLYIVKNDQIYFIKTFFQNSLFYKIFLKLTSFFSEIISYDQKIYDTSFTYDDDNDPTTPKEIYKNALRNFSYFYSKTKIPAYNNFYFIHNLSPHPPFIFDEECNYKKTSTFINTETNFDINGYRDNYICTFKDLVKFLKFVNKNDPKANIFITGDHGWDLEKNKDDSKKIFSRYDIFLAKSFDPNCSLDRDTNINLNHFKFFLNCILNTSLDYSNENLYFEKNNKISIYK